MNTKSGLRLWPDAVSFGKPGNYAIPAMNIDALDVGLTKYHEQPNQMINNKQFLACIIDHFKLDVELERFEEDLNDVMSQFLPGLRKYVRIKTNDEVLDLMIHDLSGELRAETSTGPGFKMKRKTMARQDADSVHEYLNTPFFQHPVFTKLFLKDELREIVDGSVKATRSIAVPQVTLWLRTTKYLGWLYDYFKKEQPLTPTGFAIDSSVSTWTSLLANFKLDAETQECDMVKQDSHMGAYYIDWLINFILMYCEDLDPDIESIVRWCFDEIFQHKKVIGAHGKVYNFTNGEMSGGPLTILINTIHSLFFHAITHLVLLYKNCTDTHIQFYPFVCLGDDTLMQCPEPLVFETVCKLGGHATTSLRGSLCNDMSFLSKKIHKESVGFIPYYCNLPKFLSSIQYTTGSEVEYFQKLNSFAREFAGAPAGSLEDYYGRTCSDYALEMLRKYDSLLPLANSYVSYEKLRRIVRTPARRFVHVERNNETFNQTHEENNYDNYHHCSSAWTC